MDPSGGETSLAERKRARAARRANRAREALFVKLQGVYGQMPGWSDRILGQRIDRMTGEQVRAALAMSVDEIKASRDQAAREPEYAPGTNEGGEPTRLWSHPTDRAF